MLKYSRLKLIVDEVKLFVQDSISREKLQSKIKRMPRDIFDHVLDFLVMLRIVNGKYNTRLKIGFYDRKWFR